MEEEEEEIIWFKEREISALNRTRPSEVTTTTVRGRGKEEEVVKTWDLEFTPRSEFKLEAVSVSMKVATNSTSDTSLAGSTSTLDVPAERQAWD